MSQSKEDQVKGLLEDIDVQKFIYDDLVTTRPGDSESIAETLQQIKTMEDQVARLLGQTPANTSAASSNPSTASASVVPSASATPPVPATPWALGASYLPPVPPQMSPRLPLRTATIPPDPMSTSYWPSSAPSPFAAPHYGAAPYMGVFPADTRKRARQDSGSGARHGQSSKRTAMERSVDRLAKIKEDLRIKLADNESIYEAMRTPESLRYTAETEGISEAEALSNVNEEQADSERTIRTLAQMEEDEEFARRLQAEDEPSDQEGNTIPRLPMQPIVDHIRPFHFDAEPPPVDIRPKPEPGLRSPMPGSFQSRSLSDSDSDIEEISADFYHAQSGGLPVRMPSRILPTPAQYIGAAHRHMPMPMPMPMPRAPIPGQSSTMPGYPLGRTLPWADNRHHEARAFDLVREQQDLDDDEINFEYGLHVSSLASFHANAWLLQTLPGTTVSPRYQKPPCWNQGHQCGHQGRQG